MRVRSTFWLCPQVSGSVNRTYNTANTGKKKGDLLGSYYNDDIGMLVIASQVGEAELWIYSENRAERDSLIRSS